MFKKLKQALKSLLNDNNVVTILPIEVLVPAPVIPIEKASPPPPFPKPRITYISDKERKVWQQQKIRTRFNKRNTSSRTSCNPHSMRKTLGTKHTRHEKPKKRC